VHCTQILVLLTAFSGNTKCSAILKGLTNMKLDSVIFPIQNIRVKMLLSSTEKLTFPLKVGNMGGPTRLHSKSPASKKLTERMTVNSKHTEK
jgi:hypothetical protein